MTIIRCICSICSPVVFLKQVGIAASIQLKRYLAANAKVDVKKEKSGANEKTLPIQTYIDDDLGGQTDDEVAPVAVMDEDFKEALLDNEDREGDEQNKLAEGAGAGDDKSSEEDHAAPAESTEF